MMLRLSRMSTVPRAALLLVALLSVSLFLVSCDQSSSGNRATPPPKPNVGSDSGMMPEEPAVEAEEDAAPGTETQVGISNPSSSDGRVVVAPKTALVVGGWYVSAKEQKVMVILNDTEYEVDYRVRDDIEEKYPDYAVRSGWGVKIPAADLNATNSLKVVVEGKEWWAATVLVR